MWNQRHPWTPWDQHEAHFNPTPGGRALEARRGAMPYGGFHAPYARHFGPRMGPPVPWGGPPRPHGPLPRPPPPVVPPTSGGKKTKEFIVFSCSRSLCLVLPHPLSARYHLRADAHSAHPSSSSFSVILSSTCSVSTRWSCGTLI